jgi:16S rRNA pseudouridine516 synthase
VDLRLDEHDVEHDADVRASSSAVPRIDVMLARNLGWSRATARAAIAAGRVTSGAGAPLDPRADLEVEALPLEILVDDRPARLFDRVDLMMNKPIGCVTALRDARHPTAYALLRDAPLVAELRPVGRLDLDTSGLLLWTTDGPWLQRLTHPKRALPRTYQAALARPFRAPPAPLVLEDGHRPNIEALATLPPGDAHPALARPGEATTLATITITGGAYHEVRRIFAALDSHVLALCRVSFGCLTLPADLPAGGYRAIGPGDVSP